MKKIAITGANGNLGTRLIARLTGEHEVVAIVRSHRAKQSLLAKLDANIEIQVIDYNDRAGLTKVIMGCHHAVHLVGIIKATKTNQYEAAHEGPCRALLDAAERSGLDNIVYVSLLGSHSRSSNGCLASRGRAEEILTKGNIPTLVLRVPMVLGENDYAANALMKKANSRLALTFRGNSREQPIYAGDVIGAIVHALDTRATEVVELAGPESLSRTSLISRAAEITGGHPRIVNLPLGIGLMVALLLETFLSNPPVTRDMLRILDHDDDIDSKVASERMGVTLTSLDATLERVIG